MHVHVFILSRLYTHTVHLYANTVCLYIYVVCLCAHTVFVHSCCLSVCSYCLFIHSCCLFVCSYHLLVHSRKLHKKFLLVRRLIMIYIIMCVCVCVIRDQGEVCEGRSALSSSSEPLSSEYTKTVTSQRHTALHVLSSLWRGCPSVLDLKNAGTMRVSS